MKKIKSITFVAIMMVSFIGLKAIAQKPKAGDIIGIWFNEEKTSKLQMYQVGNKFFAKIVWLKDPLDKASGKPRTDNLNPDVKMRNNPLLGLVVLKNFVYDGDGEWEDGNIYDPKNGKTYSCYFKFDGTPNLLKIRGYIGVSFLGRTTYWTRTIL
jgi:uncharacterized protein (DUF2147 family)